MEIRRIFFYAGLGIWIWGWHSLAAEESEESEPRITAASNRVETTGTGTNRVVDFGGSVRSGETVKTGGQALAELKGQGGTTVRVGENSLASFDPTNRQVKVEQGTVLIHAPAKEGPMKVEAGGVTVTVEETEPADGRSGSKKK